ncbi:hypothetical protein QJS66_17495 [Kocuria rhizophila]|nr:hypothetical protein QJS66_17495 [Kocuria rhizophila]
MIISFHRDAVRHVLDHVPPRHVCQLVSQSTVESVRAGLGVGTATAAVCRAGMRLVMPPRGALISRGGGARGAGDPVRADMAGAVAPARAVLWVWTVHRPPPGGDDDGGSIAGHPVSPRHTISLHPMASTAPTPISQCPVSDAVYPPGSGR